MFNLLVCTPFFIMLPFWKQFTVRSKALICWLIVMFLALMFASFYLNGQDWVNYYVTFFEDIHSSWFEPGFYLYFKFLSFVTFYNFGLTILVFYVIAFILLVNILRRLTRVNIPLFLILLVLYFGNTLILEQLRQFYAAIFSLYSFYYYVNGEKNKFLLFILLSISFHVSAIVLCLSFLVIYQRNTLSFTITALLSVGLIFLFFVFPNIVLPALSFFPQLSIKLTQYLEITALGFHLGPSFIFAFLALIYYLSQTKKMSPSSDANWFIHRQIFIGILVFILGLYVPFATRFSVYYILLIFLYTSTIQYTGERTLSFIKLRLLYVMLIFVFVSSNIMSYYKNEIAPIKFHQLDMHLLTFIGNEIDYGQLAKDIYKRSYENLKDYKYSQGK